MKKIEINYPPLRVPLQKLKGIITPFIILIITSISLTTSAQKFDKIDKYVFGLKIRSEATIEQTAKLVTKKSKSKIEKARAIFVWLANNIAYDVTYKVNSKEEAFKQRKSICQGYALLFEEMGMLVGLNPIVIKGIGKNIQSSDSHAWNMLEIDNQVVLIDATWGAGHVNEEKFIKSFDESWFNTDPYFFIFSHYPKDNQYQFVNNKIDSQKFNELPFFDPALEKMGINGKMVFQHFRNNASLGFPEFYSDPSKSNIIIKKMPFQSKLDVGKKYKFQFVIPANIKMAFVNEGEWYHIKDSEAFDYSPKKTGKVIIYYKTPEDEMYSGLFEYEVK